MRWYVCIVLAALAAAAAVLGPAAFNAISAPAPTAASKDPVYRSGSYALRLTEKPCDHAELADWVETGGGIGEAKAAVATMGSTIRAACWALNSGGSVVARDYRSGAKSEDVIPLDWFETGSRP